LECSLHPFLPPHLLKSHSLRRCHLPPPQLSYIPLLFFSVCSYFFFRAIIIKQLNTICLVVSSTSPNVW
jgi:hypothetical protein